MVGVVQLVRASDCGSECRGFESHHPPFFEPETSQGLRLVVFCLFSIVPVLSGWFPICASKEHKCFWLGGFSVGDNQLLPRSAWGYAEMLWATRMEKGRDE